MAVGARRQQRRHERVRFLDGRAVLRHEQSGDIKQMLRKLEDTGLIIVIDSADVQSAVLERPPVDGVQPEVAVVMLGDPPRLIVLRNQ